MMDLRYNEIQELDLEFLHVFQKSPSQKTITLRLDGNPIKCDCHVSPLLERNLSDIYRFNFPPHGLICNSPDMLAGRPLTTG